MKVFRLALLRHGSSAREVFSGLSGFSANGRWHSRGRHLDYAAQSVSLAVLERLVHYKRFDHLQPHVLVAVELPESVVAGPRAVPAGWDGADLLPAAQAIGNAWCDGFTSVALRVPSVVTRGEFNILVNARHPEWRWDWAQAPVAYAFDARLHDLLDAGRKRPR